MSSAASISFHHRKTFLALAAALLLAALLTLLAAPSARADSPQITLSTSSTNPGGEVIINGSGWAPAKTYNLYVYSQNLCNGQTTCPVPSGTKPINQADGPEKINSDGTFSFDFTFSNKAGIITYVFTVVADYPTDNPYTASVPEQVVPAGTPPSGTPISSSPTAVTPTTNPTNAATTTTPTHTSQGGGTTGGQTPTTTSGGTTNILIVVVLILLLLMIGVLVVLLRILPPKRRAIRAAYYGSGPAAAPGRATGGQRRQPSGAYYRSEEQTPWQGGVASWGEDEPRSPRGSRPLPRSPRRPGDQSGPRW
jgi:hypothetical protein